MGERRVVVLKNTDVLSAAAGGDLTAPYEHANMPASNVFVIVQQGKADKRKAFVKFVMKNGMFVECAAMKDSELVSYIVKLAKQKNLLISAKNAQTISTLADGDLSVIQNELAKLALSLIHICGNGQKGNQPCVFIGHQHGRCQYGLSGRGYSGCGFQKLGF